MSHDPEHRSLSHAIVDLAGHLAERLDAQDTEARIGAISIILALNRLTDRALHAIVQDARTAGFTWQQIGDITGTSRQGAFQRFGSEPGKAPDLLRIEPLPDAVPLAASMFAAFMADDRATILPHMTKSMAAALTPRRLAELRQQLIGELGNLESTVVDAAAITMLGDLTVVTAPLRFQRGLAHGRISFTPESAVLGLWIEPVRSSKGAPIHG